MSLFSRSLGVGLLIPALVVAAPAMAQQGSTTIGVTPSVAPSAVPRTLVNMAQAERLVVAPSLPTAQANQAETPASPERQMASSQAAPVDAPDVRPAEDTARMLVGPKIAVARVGVAPAAGAHVDAASAAAAQHMGAGENVAMMVVGGSALVAGLIIGGDGGAVVAIGGAAIGLWGLYNYIE
jgi:hypothetical protein